MPLNRWFGWRYDPAGIEAAVKRHGRFADRARHVIRDYERKDTFLSDDIVWCDENWERGAQGIGDCASWGTELAATALIAQMARKRRNRRLFIPAATEGFYGLARVEVQGKTRDDWQDGATGFHMSEAVTKFGVLQRKDYSTITGNPDHDLRQYSKERAKNWGYYGCGGEHDKGALDAIAKEHPVRDKAQVKSWEDVAAAIAGSRTPVIIASDYGTDMKRDQYGYCYWKDTWMHLMCILDVRFGKYPGARIFQSWGPRAVTGPSGDEYCDRPTPSTAGILGTSWWAPPKDVTKICAKWGDCWAFSPIEGFEIPAVDAGGGWA